MQHRESPNDTELGDLPGPHESSSDAREPYHEGTAEEQPYLSQQHMSTHDALARRRNGEGGEGDDAPEDILDNASFGSFGDVAALELEPEVVRIARQMRGLDERQFLLLADLTQKRAHRHVYSLLEYRGASWYLPSLRPVEEDEPENGIGYERTAGLWIAACGWRLELNILGYLTRIAIVVAIWLALWSTFPKNQSEVRGAILDPALTVLFSAIVGGIVARVFRIPPLVCILWMGILWNNVPTVGYYTSGTTKYVRTAATTLGLDVILIRAGLYIKPEELKSFIVTFLLFCYLPAIAELLAHSFVAWSIFDLPNSNWAFLHGSMAAAVSPAVVVPAVLQLRVDGYMVNSGPGAFIMPGAPTEMVVAIWCINFITQLTLDDGSIPLWLNILSGPLQIIGGVLLGVALGALHYGALKAFLWEAKKLPHRNYTLEHMDRVSFLSTSLLVLVGAATLAYCKTVNVAGGGAVAVTVMAMTTSALIRRRIDTPYFEDQFKRMCYGTAELWDLAVMPVLFSMVGSTIVLSRIFTADFFPQMLACIVAGIAARMVMALIVTSQQPYTKGERFVMAVGWCGKASVQAALGTIAIDRANQIFDKVAAREGTQAAQENLVLGQRVANSAALLILVCAPIASMVLVRVGPLLLTKDATGGGGGVVATN